MCMVKMFMFRAIPVIFLVFVTVCANPSSTPSVIIVGAGAAGIAAATKLLENNISNVKILEAEGRIGGRVYSVEFGDAVIDLGAQWCHGKENNIVYELVKDLDLLENDNLVQKFYNSSGRLIDQEFAQELFTQFLELYYGEVEESAEISMGDYLTKKYNDIVLERYKNNPEKLKFALDFLYTLAKDTLLNDGTFSWFHISAKFDYEESDGNQELGWKGRGYQTILDILMKTHASSGKPLLDKKEIYLNKEVTKVVWDDTAENGVLVECLDNTTFKADHIIFTPSLGVLKDHYDTLFQPQLPQAKIDAITDLGISAVMKVFLHFPQKWWSSNESSLQTMEFVWSAEDRSFISENLTDRSWLVDLVDVYPVPRNPNVLEAWFAGESVPQIELFSDDQIIDGIMDTLNKFVGNEYKNISKPDAVLRSKWYSNPHFRGTYSYQTVQARKRGVSAEEVLSKPLTSSNGKQVLLFAGEATNPIHYATVHGAVESGFREAERIIQLYK